jgi:uncharacterized protein (TIGR02186 family)
MMRIVAMACFLISIFASGQAAAQTQVETVEADVSARSVAITSSYSGKEIVVFGTVENSRQPKADAGTYDVVIIVEGTSVPAVVRKKSNVAGLWINTSSVHFGSFPSYYAILTTRPIDKIADAEVLNKNEIGFRHVRMQPAGAGQTLPKDPKEIDEFREAIVRLKQSDGLYVMSDHGAAFIGRSLFRGTVQLPPNVPVGPLTARIYLFKDGELLSQTQSQVGLQREGIERYLYDAAFDYPVFYGFGTILFAAAAGLAAAYIFRRPSST